MKILVEKSVETALFVLAALVIKDNTPQKKLSVRILHLIFKLVLKCNYKYIKYKCKNQTSSKALEKIFYRATYSAYIPFVPFLLGFRFVAINKVSH